MANNDEAYSQEIDALERQVGQPLQPSYRAFLSGHSDDLAVGDFVLLYGRGSLVERNETYETQRYCPGHITIGDDGGGRQILLAVDTRHISLVDAGSMEPQYAREVAQNFDDWLASGCPLPPDDI